MGDEALDGLLPQLDWHTDAAKYNDKKTFDIVLGVFLNAIPCASGGNLYVRVGSHHTEKDAREESQLNGGLHSGRTDAVPGTAIIIESPGTVVLFDKDLVHAGGPNLSPDIRYALYCRMRFSA